LKKLICILKTAQKSKYGAKKKITFNNKQKTNKKGDQKTK